MKQNVGNIDKAIRILVAVIFGVLYITHIVTGTIGIVLLAVGLIFVLTSIVGICPIYLTLGLSSRGAKK